jgi:hypothetical protein
MTRVFQREWRVSLRGRPRLVRHADKPTVVDSSALVARRAGEQTDLQLAPAA